MRSGRRDQQLDQDARRAADGEISSWTTSSLDHLWTRLWTHLWTRQEPHCRDGRTGPAALQGIILRSLCVRRAAAFVSEVRLAGHNDHIVSLCVSVCANRDQ
ncbi:unnamed protein product [Merluccius merluccius]